MLAAGDVRSVVLLSLLYAVSGLAYQVQFTAVTPGKALGNVLVLDVSSLWRKYPTQPSASIHSASECQLRCAALPGCNGYAFCGSKEGCGTGCRAYNIKHPPLSAAAAVTVVLGRRGERDEQQDSQLQLPVPRFGPYVPNRNSSSGCDASNTDKWAFETCTLLNGSQSGKLASAAEGAGWSTAWLSQPVPSACSSISSTACAACYATPKPDVCLACIKDKRAASYVHVVSLIADGVPTGSTGARALDQCVACATLDTADLQQRCISCVLDAGACSSCVPYPGAATQLKLAVVGGCISCVQAKGRRFTGTCLTCARSHNASECFGCLAQFYPAKMCKTSAYVDCYKPDFDNPCAACQNGAAEAYDSCISCYGNPASKPDCDFCSALPDKEPQLHCYACSKQAQAVHSELPGGCGLCFAHSKNAATQQQCIICVTSTNIPKANKEHCHLCASADLTPQQATRCYKCLADAKGGPDCSTCSQATSSDAAFSSCMACYSYADSGPDCDECSGLQAASAQGNLDALRKQCFDCVSRSNLIAPADAGFAPLGSCAACLSGTGDVPSCVACNTNPSVSVTAKSLCHSCAINADPWKRASCIQCLQSNRLGASGDYQEKCGISY